VHTLNHSTCVLHQRILPMDAHQTNEMLPLGDFWCRRPDVAEVPPCIGDWIQVDDVSSSSIR